LIPGEPSRTALAAATHRAAHQLLEDGCIFADPLALRILNAEPDAVLATASAEPARSPIRLFIACRHRVAEDRVAQAVAAGVRQVVILGAGLDTGAYRSPHGLDVSWFEVDHPATQAWKQRRLRQAGIEVPAFLQYVPIDFETEILGERLAAAGFDDAAPSIFVWLGVVPYLSEAAIFGTLAFIAGLPGGAEVVFDYAWRPSAKRGSAFSNLLLSPNACVRWVFPKSRIPCRARSLRATCRKPMLKKEPGAATSSGHAQYRRYWWLLGRRCQIRNR